MKRLAVARPLGYRNCKSRPFPLLGLYWVAALSAVNTIIQLSGGKWSFSMGLGITQLLADAGSVFGATANTAAIAVSGVVIILLAFFGSMACRGAIWAFVTGIVVLGLDPLLLFFGTGGDVVEHRISHLGDRFTGDWVERGDKDPQRYMDALEG